MSKFKKFGEFVKGKVKELDVTDGLAGKDYDGPLSTKPIQEPTKGKKDKALPYKATGEEEGGVVWTAPDDGSKKGLAQNATPGMTPATSPLGKKVDDMSKARPKPKKLTAEQFIENTKDLSSTQFVNYVLESHGDASISPVTDLFGNEFTPEPLQTIQYMAGLLMGNHYYLEKFVREVRRRGGMDALMDEMCDCGGYDLIVDHLENEDLGQERAGKLVKSMNDKFMKNVNMFSPDEDEDEKELGESVGPGLDQMGMAGMPNMGGQAAPGASGGKLGGGKIGGGGVGGYQANPDDSSSELDGRNKTDKGMGSQGAGRNPSNAGGGGMPMGGSTQPNFGGGVVPPIAKKMSAGEDVKYGGAGKHLIDELTNYPRAKTYMKGKCIDC